MKPSPGGAARFHAASRGAVPPALEIGLPPPSPGLTSWATLRLGPPGLIDREVANASKSPGLGTLATKPSRNPRNKRKTAAEPTPDDNPAPKGRPREQPRT